MLALPRSLRALEETCFGAQGRFVRYADTLSLTRCHPDPWVGYVRVPAQPVGACVWPMRGAPATSYAALQPAGALPPLPQAVHPCCKLFLFHPTLPWSRVIPASHNQLAFTSVH